MGGSVGYAPFRPERNETPVLDATLYGVSKDKRMRRTTTTNF